MAYFIETEIKKWLELLVNSVDMFASDAGEYFRILYSELSPKELSEKYRKNTVVVSVSCWFMYLSCMC